MRDDASAIAEVHVASWRSAYRGLIDDAYLDGIEDTYEIDGVRYPTMRYATEF